MFYKCKIIETCLEKVAPLAPSHNLALSIFYLNYSYVRVDIKCTFIMSWDMYIAPIKYKIFVALCPGVPTFVKGWIRPRCRLFPWG